MIESEAHAMRMAERLVKIAAAAKVPLIFKASYDKANRSSLDSYRGPGLDAGLGGAAENQGALRRADSHRYSRARAGRGGAEVCDVLQMPAFLSRQTDLLLAAGKTGRVVNLKKGQFLSPWEMANAVEKVREHRESQHYSDRARRLVRLQQSGRGYALVSDPGQDRLPGDF